MAILPNPNAVPGSDDIYGYDPFEGMNSTSASSNVMHGDTNYDTNALRIQFISSAAYKQIVAIFEKSPQSDFWMAKLQNLVSSLQIPSRGFFDDVANGLTGKYAKEFTAALQSAYSSLNALYNEWFQWFNELPVEQRKQFEDAGLNIALDGGAALKGSQFLGSDLSLQAPDVIEQGNKSFDNAINYASAITGGFLSFISTFNGVFGTAANIINTSRQLDLQHDTSQDTLNLQRQQLGLQPISLGKSTDPYVVGQDNLNGPISAVSSRNALESIRNLNQYFPESALQASINSGQSEVFQEIYGELGNMRLQSIYLDSLLQNEIKSSALSQAEFDKKRTEAQSSAFDSLGAELITSEMSSQTSQFKESAQLSSLRKSVSEYKRKVISDWIQKANDNNNPYSWMYQTMLMKLSANLNEYGNPADVSFEYGENSTDIITKWLKSICDFKPRTVK